MGNEGKKLFERFFRLKFGIKLCALTVAGVFTLTFVTYLLTSRSLGGTYAEAIYTIYDLKVRIFPLIFASFYSIFILALVTGAIAAISVFFSHKIAGPLYRLERSLELIGRGDLTVDTRFRGYDQLKALADDINGMVRSLNHLSRSCTDALGEVERGALHLSALLDEREPDFEAIVRAAAELDQGVVALKKAASCIRAGEGP
jgi:methyl-accepting chemotaxis protein